MMKTLLKKNKDILASIRDGFYVLDQDGNFIYANQIAANDLGFIPDELIGRNIWQLFPDFIDSFIYKLL